MRATWNMFRDFCTAADCFVNALPEYQPHWPYAIGGFSHGGLVAYELAYLLTQVGAICRSAGRHGPKPDDIFNVTSQNQDTMPAVFAAFGSYVPQPYIG